MLGITRKGGAGAAAEGEGLRSNGEGAMQEPTYWESLRVGWMLFWRIAGSFFAVIFLFNVWLLALFPEMTRGTPPVWTAAIPIMTATLLSLFLLMPWVVRAMLRKQFQGFHIQFVRQAVVRMIQS